MNKIRAGYARISTSQRTASIGSFGQARKSVGARLRAEFSGIQFVSHNVIIQRISDCISSNFDYFRAFPDCQPDLCS